jgi:hypothetical protein
MRLIVGFLVLNWPRVDMVAVCERTNECRMRTENRNDWA